MSQSIENKVIARVHGHGKGWVFSQKDFTDLAGRQAIDLAFHRLVAKSTIRRVIRGIYYFPRYSDLLGKELSPDINQVAHSIARKFGWRIQASGVSALNLIGLSTQVPGQYVYLSDGPSRTYQVDNTQLDFQNTALKETGFKHQETGLVVQALKSMGAEHITDSTIEDIRAWIPEDKRLKILKDSQRVAEWVYVLIKRICREVNDG